jgi:hypothetical protein
MKPTRPQSFGFLAAACTGAAAALLGWIGASPPTAHAGADQAVGNELRAPEAFARIKDREERAQALFLEASRVLLHPRCRNCHPDGDSPAQGDDGRLHDPPVARGADDRGVPGLACSSCHQDHNLELARVPGAPQWHLAPRTMAWVGRTPRAICEQLKDPARNGNRSLAQIVDHVAHDQLVAWGWSPGPSRSKAPGTQERFGALMAAWVQDGAACPREGGGR